MKIVPQKDPQPEKGVSLSQSSQEFSPDETSYNSEMKKLLTIAKNQPLISPHMHMVGLEKTGYDLISIFEVKKTTISILPWEKILRS